MKCSTKQRKISSKHEQTISGQITLRQNSAYEETNREIGWRCHIVLSSYIVQVYYLIIRYEAEMIHYLSKGLEGRAKDSLLQKQDWTEMYAAITTADDQTTKLSRQARFGVESGAQYSQASQLKSLEKLLQSILQGQVGAVEKQDWKKFLEALAAGNSESYESTKRRLADKRNENTCKWFLEDDKFTDWAAKTNARSSLLWLTAAPGSGKSMWAAHLIDEILPKRPLSSTTCYYLFNDGTTSRSSESALCAILHQIFSKAFCSN